LLVYYLDYLSLLFFLCIFGVKLFTKRNNSISPLRPFIGGIILATAFYFIGSSKYAGLGVLIVDAFSVPNAPYDFLLKILFTGLL
jgi:H+/Cl- antiporter ClcA